MSITLTPAQLAAYIDQTLLAPTKGFAEGRDWLESARGAGFASVCVSQFLVPMAAEIMAGTSTKVCSVAGFPLGTMAASAKAEEATLLVEAGCTEVDVVVNFAALAEGDDEYVLAELTGVVAAVNDASAGHGLVKVILETGQLEADRIVRGCELCVEAGAAYVKTSTGFGPRGASVADVRIMRASVPDGIGVKAAGGIRDLETALMMIEAGATRVGTSAGLDILKAAAS